MLAGISLAQSLASPGFGPATLTLHMAYADVALTLQRAANSLSLFAFIGAVDQHTGLRKLPLSICLACTRLSPVWLACTRLACTARALSGRRKNPFITSGMGRVGGSNLAQVCYA